MANLNAHDVIFLSYPEFKGFKEFLEQEYGFKIRSAVAPNIISFTSKKLILETTTGKLFLKEKPVYCSDDLSLRKSADFQIYAGTKTRLIPKIIRTKDNEVYVVWNGRNYFLTEFVEGRYYNGSRDDIEKILLSLKDFQRIGLDYLREHEHAGGEQFHRFESYEVAKGIFDLEKFFTSEDDRPTFNELSETYKALISDYKKLGTNDYLMAHSDFILFNLLLNQSGVVAINDFDNAKVLPKIHDLAEFFVSATLINYNAPLTNLKNPVITKPDHVRAVQIIKSYSELFKLSEKDFRLFAIVVEIIWLWTVSLSIFKNDYSFNDIQPVIQAVNEHTVRKYILDAATAL